MLIRSDGEPTYFAADIAYHRDKLERGAERLIDPLGRRPPRLRAADAGGARGAGRTTPDCYEAPIMQLVHLVEGGERAQMSKRKGEFVTLDELIDDIGVDAARFFMLQRSHDTALDLDLELARRAVAGQPRLLRPVRARADRRASCARRSPRAARRLAVDDGADEARWRGGRAEERRSRRPPSRPSGRWSSGCSSFPAEVGAAPPSAARRTGWPPTRRRPRPTSTPSTATARSSGRPTGSSRPAWRSAWRRSA